MNFIEEAPRWAACQHKSRTGGNDYLLCNECGLMWDYRRETPTQAIARTLLSEIKKLQEQKDLLLKEWIRACFPILVKALPSETPSEVLCEAVTIEFERLQRLLELKNI